MADHRVPSQQANAILEHIYPRPDLHQLQVQVRRVASLTAPFLVVA
jgi:hypothetical protein